jgi:hypothetical protein
MMQPISPYHGAVAECWLGGERKACLDYQNKAFVNLTCKRIHVDEI